LFMAGLSAYLFVTRDGDFCGSYSAPKHTSPSEQGG
jgi:hypothetical protein